MAVVGGAVGEPECRGAWAVVGGPSGPMLLSQIAAI
ncbi:DUF6053 domain-containing protein [Lysobacter enzymogenes]